MNGWNISPGDVITGLLALCVGLLTFFGKRYMDKVDALDAVAVRKHDLKELEERMESTRRWMHEQNQNALKEINQNVKDGAARVDDLVRDLMHRNGGGR